MNRGKENLGRKVGSHLVGECKIWLGYLAPAKVGTAQRAFVEEGHLHVERVFRVVNK